MNQRYSVIMKSDLGEPVYLGDVLSQNVDALMRAFEEAGCGVYGDLQSSYDIPLAANPARIEDLPEGVDSLLRASLQSPHKAMSPNVALLADRVTIGRGRGDRVSYPITKKQLERVSLEEAAVNLAIFFLSTRRMLTPEMLQMLRDDRYIDIEKLVANSSAKRKTRGTIQKITTNFVKWMISNNAKLVKSKLPASLGVGTPSEVPGWNYGPTDGSEGLQFLPNATLIRRVEADQISFKDAIEQLDVGLFDQDSANWIFKDLVLETLDGLGDGRAKTCCPHASKECRLVCLADTTQRSATRKDVLGRDFEDIADPALDEVSYNRMGLGCRQTAFMANPYYFMRVLLEAIHKRALSYPKKIDKYNEKERAKAKKEKRRADVITPAQKAEYLKKVPPSVRLNVLSDYVWELICPDLFTIFGGRSKFNGVSMPYVQFYDYTKIPGRWPAETRRVVAEHLGQPESEYNLPRNYHITFSYSGARSSLQYSEIQNWAGQNTTFAFQTTSIGASEIKTLLEPQFAAYRSLIERSELGEGERLRLESSVRDYLMNFKKRLLAALKKVKIEGLTVRSKATPIKEALPSTYMGYQVINGDFSDLRFLDDYQKADPEESAIVGLKWKVPHGARFEVPELAEYRWSKLSSKAKRTYTSKGRRPSAAAQYTPFSGSAFPELGMGRKSQEAGAAFAQFRLGMDIALDLGLSEPVRVFIVPKSTGAGAVRDVFTDIALGADESDGLSFTFVTESGSVLNEAQLSVIGEAVDVMARVADETGEG